MCTCRRDIEPATIYCLFSGSRCPHLQSGRFHLFKKNLTQWWVEPERKVAVGWGRRRPAPSALPIPRSFTAFPGALCPLPTRFLSWGDGWLALQRRKEWSAELEGLRRSVDLAVGWVEGMQASLGLPRP